MHDQLSGGPLCNRGPGVAAPPAPPARSASACSKGPEAESNPWPLQGGQSLCMWGACSSNGATRHPIRFTS